MALQPIIQEYMSIPPVTRLYTTACVITSAAVTVNLISPFQLYYNPILILRKGEIWRPITAFLFYGMFQLNYFFTIVFTYRYCKMLEEGSFRGKSADFVMMLLFGGIFILILATFLNLLFLGQALTIMLVYVWARRTPYVHMNFFGLLAFQAPYLPWVLLGFSAILGNGISIDIVGIIVGHTYYFLEDVWPNHRLGWKTLKTPEFLKKLLDEPMEYEPLPEEPMGEIMDLQ